MAKPKDPQDPGPVPGEEPKRRWPSIPLTLELGEYVRQIASATGTSQRDLIERISQRDEIVVAVREVCSAAVDDHVRDVQARIGFKVGGPEPEPERS